MNGRTLAELNAVFVAEYDHQKGSFREVGTLLSGAQGVLFDCPLTNHQCNGEVVPPGSKPCHSHSVLVWFRDCRVPPEATPKARWMASGSCIADLTLQPSINLDVPWTDEKGVTHPSSCTWHGWVQGGTAK